MNRLSPALTALLFLCSSVAFAQDYQPPTDLPGNKEEFIKSEKEFIAAAKWLESTPLGKDEKKRQLTGAWVIAWITNSPTVTVTMYGGIMKPFDKNPELLIVFMAGYSRYVLENNYNSDELKNNLAGIKSVISCANLGGSIKKDKNLTALLEADKEGKLEDWVKKAMEAK